MIHLTRLNNNPFILNADLVKWIENAPDTVLTLVTGEKVLVSESSAQVVEKIVTFRRSILAELPICVAISESPAADLTQTVPTSVEKG
jgi:flagellar protein FlbD